MSTPQISTKFPKTVQKSKQNQSKQKSDRARSNANRLANDPSAQANQDLSRSLFNRIDSINSDDPKAMSFSSSSVPWTSLPPLPNHQQWNSPTLEPYINTEESIAVHSTIQDATAQFILIGRIEVGMCTNLHDLLYSLLDHILTTSELKQYVEVSTLIRIAQNPVVLFTNITPNSTHGYIKFLS